MRKLQNVVKLKQILKLRNNRILMQKRPLMIKLHNLHILNYCYKLQALPLLRVHTLQAHYHGQVTVITHSMHLRQQGDNCVELNWDQIIGAPMESLLFGSSGVVLITGIPNQKLMFGKTNKATIMEEAHHHNIYR